MKNCKECINFNLNYGFTSTGVYEKSHGMCNINSKEKIKSVNHCCEQFKKKRNYQIGR